MVDEDVVRMWRRLENTLLGSGRSRYAAHKIIARWSNYSVATVYRKLTPRQARWQREYDKNRGPRYRSEEDLARRHEYDTKYKRTVRKLAQYLEDLTGNRAELSVSDLREEIRADSGVTSSEATLSRRLRQYIRNGCPRGPPIREREGQPGVYCVRIDS